MLWLPWTFPNSEANSAYINTPSMPTCSLALPTSRLQAKSYLEPHTFARKYPAAEFIQFTLLFFFRGGLVARRRFIDSHDAV